MTGRQTVLLVDDDVSNLKLLRQAFGEDCRVLFATGGVEALAIAQRELPDLIILDVMMADMNGHEVLRQIKADERTGEIPVIFLTGRGHATDERIGLELGAVDFWTKPVKLDIARIRARNHLELKRHRDTLSRLALTDALCGIPNRRGFDERLEREWRRCQRTERSLSLIMIDVDHFKAFNDQYGHPAGDECLRCIARIIDDAFDRPGDMVARYGGEEFACIVPETTVGGAVALAERLRTVVSEALIIHESSPVHPYVTISIGIASMIPDYIRKPQILLERADEALYSAKHTGRNRVVAAP